MKLLNLEIAKFRGIKFTRLEPNGKNFIIWGPNGSGKSAIVDAIAFVLTGRIPRLTGEGTGGITLAKYGSHIDHRHELEEATVKATFEVSGFSSPLTLQRSISDPSKLGVMGAAVSEIEPILTVVQKHQHSLSRREILKFVAAEASKRSEEVQAVLNLEELEQIRKSLTRVQNLARIGERVVKTSVANAENATKTTLGLSIFSWSAILSAVNTLRAQLGGAPTTEVKSADVKRDIHPPTRSTGPRADNPVFLKNELSGLSAILPLWLAESEWPDW